MDALSNLFHALHYNVLYSTNNLYGYGDMTPQLADTYADAYLDDGAVIRDIDGTELFVQNHATDEVQGIINAAISGITSWQKGSVSADEAQTRNDALALFGHSFLPWDKQVLQDGSGNWVYLHTYNNPTDFKPMFNPLRREILKDKIVTLVKLGAVGAGTWYGGKYLYRNYRSRV